MACDHVQNDARVLSEVILVTHLHAQSDILLVMNYLTFLPLET